MEQWSDPSMRGHVKRSVVATVGDAERSAAGLRVGQRVLAEQVRLLYARAPIAQATVVVNAALTAWVFRAVAPRGLLTAWLAALCGLAALRMRLVWTYRRSRPAPSEAEVWAHRFAAEAALAGMVWGVGAVLFYAPLSIVHQVFLVFVLGGMTAGAASSNASYTPAFVAFAAPTLLPIVVRLVAEHEPVHAVMAFMLTLFGVAMTGFSRSGSRAVEQEIRLRLENEALVEDLASAQQHLESLNANLERLVHERTNEIIDAHQALREADRRKDEFLAVLSHELRNPLAPIRNSLFVLDRAPPGGTQARHAKEVIDRQVNQLTRLVADLLDVGRITRGKVQLQRERIDLCEVVHRTLEDHRSFYAARAIELRDDLPQRPVWVDADSARMAQVLTNLLHNAAKFTQEGGTVLVTLRQERAMAVLTVRDTGAGIAPDLLARIFEPFIQGTQALDRSTGGLGLGLALVKALVELHGGDVTAHSEGIGKGSEFTVRVPAEVTPSVKSRPELKLVTPRTQRVLVVEDNVDAAESLKEVLELQEHVVAVAYSGLEALDMAREFRPDLVLCDIGLPGMDGYGVARAFRADEVLRDVPLVAMTGYALSEDRKRATDAGFDRHLAKPTDLGELEQVVAELSARRAG